MAVHELGTRPEVGPVRYVLELIATFVTTGTAFALTAAVVSGWIVRNTMGRDAAECVLAVETTRVHGPPDRLGAAAARLSATSTPAATVHGRSSWQMGLV